MITTPRTSAAASRAGHARKQALQAMLHDRQREMQNVLQRRFGQAPSDGPDDGLDDSEHAEADIQEHIEVALIQMKGDTLRKVEEAMLRLDAGEYGDCIDCEGEISEKRLNAMPFAVRCTACEQSHEQRSARERRTASSQGFLGFLAGQVG